MITIRTTQDSKTFLSKETLKVSNFVYDPASKSWSREFNSIEEFQDWEENKFRSPSYAGRRQAIKFNSQTSFVIVEPK